jgi:hypothetical protein
MSRQASAFLDRRAIGLNCAQALDCPPPAWERLQSNDGSRNKSDSELYAELRKLESVTFDKEDKVP